MISNRTVVLLSGGMDSTALLYFLLGQGGKVFPLAVNYGQRHARELRAAEAVAWRAEAESAGHPDAGRVAPLKVIDIPGFAGLAGGSSQTDEAIPVPEGHYADASMKVTVVPNRNMVLLSLATAYAVSMKCSAVAYAAHSGDHAIYPDCRPVFAQRMEDAMLVCDYEPVYLRAPFLGISKAEIVKNAQQFLIPPPFDLTYSCYNGRTQHCGKCGTCVERREAFSVAGVPDPTDYEE